ncbi:MAG: hypothetical protein HUN05_20555 [Desulfobacter sp.]|nr:MAG: hypothetical protein HUN05_20555 [Desulfobacter sp.]
MKTNVVVAGWGQVTQPKQLKTLPQDPMGMMVQASVAAARNLKTPDLLPRVEAILTVKSLSVYYKTPAQDLAQRLGASPKINFESRIGGNSPQTLINTAAGMIARKEVNSVLVAGAETYVPRSLDPETPDRIKPDNALLQGIPKDYTGNDASGVTPLEARYGIQHPMQGFPLFETALWAASGMDISTYLNKVAAFWSQFSQRASTHPYAWTKTAKAPEEILRVSDQNRPIAFPYTKFMNSFVTVDQGAAIILMSQDYAKTHGSARGRTVYFSGGGYAQDRQQFMIQKTDFTSSPPLKAAVNKALHRSGFSLEDMDAFDLYSCFPSAVSIAKKMLDIKENDPRPMTLTGGLGFFGGPGNNYNLHAVATLCSRIAQGLTKTGMVTALGWFMHKHAAGIYSCLPPEKPLDTMDIEDKENFMAGQAPVKLDPNPSGTGIIETYTIVYNRDHSPAYGVVYGKTQPGDRFIGRTPWDPALFERLSTRCMVGRKVSLTMDPQTGLTLARLT